MPRRRSSRIRVSRPRRKFVWAHLLNDFGAAAPTGSIDILTDFRTIMGITANLPGCTVVRIRGSVQMEFAAAGSFDHTSGFAHGIYVDTVTSVAALPLGLPNEDWMFWEWSPVSRGYDAIGPTNTDRILSVPIDARAMRKVEEVQQTLFYVWEVTGPVDTAEVNTILSIGIKLP